MSTFLARLVALEQQQAPAVVGIATEHDGVVAEVTVNGRAISLEAFRARWPDALLRVYARGSRSGAGDGRD